MIRFFCFCVRGALCGLCGFFVFVPLGAQTPADRSKPPALAPLPQLELPAIQHRALSNGLAVWMIESHEVPLVQVTLLVRAGAADDPEGKFGTASFTAGMLDEGAGSRSALEIADAIELLGATLTTTISFDASAVRLNVPVKRFSEALPIVADVAMRPTFGDKDLERLRQERLTTMLQARDDPASIASTAFSRAVFGPTHRYGTGIFGTQATLKALGAQDLRAFHAAFYEPSNATLVVVGDATPDGVLPELEKHFGSWKTARGARRPELPSTPRPERTQVYLVDKPGAAQSQIRVGWVGVPRSTPDYFPISVLNTVLGGSFTSRLNQNLREEHGYAYGASTAFDMRRAPGPFVAAAAVQADKTAESVQEMFNELKRIREPVPSDELARSKNYMALGFPGEFETAADLARHLEELIVYGLPEDLFERYVPQVQAVTAAAVQKAAERYIQPERSAVVVVGDRKAAESALRALNLGDVRVMTVDEVFAP